VSQHGTPEQPRDGEAPESAHSRRIDGYGVSLLYRYRYMVITLGPEDWINFRIVQDARISAQVKQGRREDLVLLELAIEANRGFMLIELPFYATQADELRDFVEALERYFPGNVRVMRSRPGVRAPGPARAPAATDARNGGTGDPAPPRRQALPPVAIRARPAVGADDPHWISLRPPKETERLLSAPAHLDGAPPAGQ